MSDEPVTLELISRQLERVLNEIGAFRDDMRVQTAILLRLRRLDAKMDRVIDDLRDIKTPMTAVEEAISGVNRRLDRHDARLDRIERRLELVEP